MIYNKLYVMGLIYLTFNFAGIFNGCFKKDYSTELSILPKMISQETDADIIISMILLKLVNGPFTAALLYRYNPGIRYHRII